MVASAIELAINRLNTEKFISLDPTVITLTPRQTIWVAGTKKKQAQTPRNEQVFKVIWLPGDGITYTIDGITMRFNFIIVGKYDAEVSIGDFWKVGSQQNEIDYVFPSNDYEVKAGGTSHGAHPSG